MILKILTTSSLENTLRYISRVGAALVAGDLIGGTPKERARVMREVCLDGRPPLKDEGIHLVLALAPGQHLTPAQWDRAIRAALKGLGMQGCLWEAWMHLDKGHEHVHIAVTARKQSGRRVDRRGDRMKAKRICRQLEKDLGFPPVNSDARNARRKRPAAAADPGVVAEMQRKVARFVGARGMDRCYTFAQLAIELRRTGVELVPKIRDGRVVGLGFRMGGTYIRAADLHKDFTFTALKRSGLDWNPTRDLPVIHPKGESHEAVLNAPDAAFPRLRPYDTFTRTQRILRSIGLDAGRARRIARAATGAAGGPGGGAADAPARRGPGAGGHPRASARRAR